MTFASRATSLVSRDKSVRRSRSEPVTFLTSCISTCVASQFLAGPEKFRLVFVFNMVFVGNQ